MKLVTLNESQGLEAGAVKVVDYDDFLPTLNVSLQDFYGQRVVTESDGFAQLFVTTDPLREYCGTDYGGNIGGGILEKFVDGVATFTGVDAFCIPGGVMFMGVTSTLAMTDTEIEVRFRPCVVGGKKCSTCSHYVILLLTRILFDSCAEFFAERVCSPCPEGTYSFTDPANVSSLSSGEKQNDWECVSFCEYE